jgi:two-component system response regulator TtrR
VRQRLASLSAREREVLDGVVAGKMNKVIADGLGISSKTVEAHRARVMDKMKARSLAELIRLVSLGGFDKGYP